MTNPLLSRPTISDRQQSHNDDLRMLAGYEEARAYIERVVSSNRQSKRRKMGPLEDFGGGALNDHGQAHLRLSPDDAININFIFRLYQACEIAPVGALCPHPGIVVVIILAAFKDRVRLTRLLPKLSLITSNPMGTPRVLCEGSEPNAGLDLQSIFDAAPFCGPGAIAIVSRGDTIPFGYEPLVSAKVRFPETSLMMIRATLGLLHPSRSIPLSLGVTEKQIARLSSFALAPVFGAPDLEGALYHLKRAVAPAAHSTAAKPTLDDVHGQPEATAALHQVVKDLISWRSERIEWSDVTRSFLLVGPPGTGKTMLANALAESAGITLVKTSYSECQRHGHQGDMLSALYEAGERAISGSPSIFFVDEIDSFSRRDESRDGYVVGVVNGLLTLLDRLLTTNGVIVIAATNDAMRVDPAVVRAGRFDRHIYLGPPDTEGIRAMLESMLPATVTQSEGLAEQLLGLTGAEVAAMVRAANTLARAADRILTIEDVHAAADTTQPRSDFGYVQRVAAHEAGHLLASHLLGMTPATSIQISSRGGEITRPKMPCLTAKEFRMRLCSLLAGRVAEELLLGDVSQGAGEGAESDLSKATQIALRMEACYGFGPSLTWWPADTHIGLLPDALRSRLEAALQLAQSEARELLGVQRSALEHIANALSKHREMNAPAIAALILEALPAASDQPRDVS